jgi:hypothetical protein
VEAVGELVRRATRPEPGIGPVCSGKEQEGRGVLVQVGSELPELAPLAEESPDPLLVPAPLGDELLAARAFEIAPLLDEDGGDVQLLGDDVEVRAQRAAELLGRGERFRDGVERGVERRRPVAGDLPEQVLLRLDVRVQRGLLDAERLREVADRRAVVAALGEQPGRGAR